MNVFISWSGDASEHVAMALREWLPKVVQVARPYYSPQDLEKGSRWFLELSKILQSTSFALICVTRGNFQAPWIMFEAGAIAKQLDIARVCPILFEVEPIDISGPLMQFQMTQFGQKGMLQVVKTINSHLGERALTEGVLESVFQKWWPDLESCANGARGLSGDRKSSSETLRELLQLTKEMHTGLWFSGLHKLHKGLQFDLFVRDFCEVVDTCMTIEGTDTLEEFLEGLRAFIAELVDGNPLFQDEIVRERFLLTRKQIRELPKHNPVSKKLVEGLISIYMTAAERNIEALRPNLSDEDSYTLRQWIDIGRAICWAIDQRPKVKNLEKTRQFLTKFNQLEKILDESCDTGDEEQVTDP